MLKQRLITAAILIPLIIICVLKAPTEVVAIIFAIIIMTAAWEWGALLKLAAGARLSFIVVLATAMLFSFFWVLEQHHIMWAVLAFASLLWLVLIIAVVSVQRRGDLGADLPRGQYLLLGLLLFVFVWLAALFLHGGSESGPALLLYVFGLVWLVDAGAYFSGRQWGKDTLASHISPGKTWQGFYGGVAAGLIFALAGAWYFGFSAGDYLAFVALSLFVVVFSVFGDLFESWLKRRAGVKDSGQLLPGHGGALDRIDSLLAALPVTAFGLSFFEVMK